MSFAAVMVASCGGGASSQHPLSGDGGALGGSDGGNIAISVDAGPSRPGAVRMAVPAYFYPGQDWQRLIAAAPTVGIIVFNPDSGPGTGSGTAAGAATGDPAYAAAITQAQSAGIAVLGYVSTSYGQRPEGDILADISAYYDLYRPSGIYLAEGPMDADCASLEAEYHRLADAARARDPHAFLAVGTRFCPTYIYFFDLMVQFARNWTEYQSYQPPSWMPANSPERFCHLIHDVPVADAGSALSRALINGAGWVYVTDEADPNPWGGLPGYFEDEVQAVARQGQAPTH